MKFARTLIASVAAGLLATSAIAMTKEEHKTAKDNIEATYKADKDKCDALTANAKDICQKEAKGKEKVAKAELKPSTSPAPRTPRKLPKHALTLPMTSPRKSATT